MDSYLLILLSLLTLVLGHPFQNDPLLNGNPFSPATKLSPRTDISVVELHKRGAPAYPCPSDMQYCSAWCNENTVTWNCVAVSKGQKLNEQTFKRPCYTDVCVAEYNGGKTNYPITDCGASSACVVTNEPALHLLVAESADPKCMSIGGDDYQGKQLRISTTIFSLPAWAKNVYTPVKNEDISVSITSHDDKNIYFNGLQSPIENGQFITTTFLYSGKVEVCAQLYDQPNAFVFCTFIGAGPVL